MVGTEGGRPRPSPLGNLTVSLSHPPIIGMGMGTRTHGTTALQYQIVPSRIQITMARVTPVTMMTTTMGSPTVGTIAAWCPTQTRKM